MDPADAATHLGVAPDAHPDDVRRAFRHLVHRHHPDHDGGDATATRTLVEAYRTLTAPATRTDPAPTAGATADGDTLHLPLPPDEAFLHLLDAADRIGDVTYVDADAGILQARVTFDDGRNADLVVTLQGRAATGETEAFCTLEPPDLPITAVVEALAAHLA